MRSRCLAALLCGGFLALSAFAADKKAPADAAKGVDGDKLPAGQFTGKLTGTPGSDGSFTVNVEIDRAELNPNAARNEGREVQQLLRDQERVQQLQADVARSRNANEYRQRVQQLAQEMQRVQMDSVKQARGLGGEVKVVKDHKEIDFHAADEMKVRMLNLPVRFDDKGNPKEYTKEELKEMKGKDADLPGYDATLDSLKAGDTVQVTLKAVKPAKKDADKDAEAKKGNEVTMIVILAEDAGDNNKGKKKK